MKKSLNWLFDYPNLQIYQYDEAFKFSLDSILLAEFAQIKKTDKTIIDLCTGNAVIPILISNKYQKDVVGIEIQPEIMELARESITINHLADHIQLIEDSVLNIKNYFPGNNFDVVLCNPPYFKVSLNSHLNENLFKRIARHEICVTLENIIKIASYLLKDKGRFYLVHVPDRIDEVLVYVHQYNMAVKEMQFIHSKIEDKPIVVLFTIVKSAKFGVKVYAPVYIQNLKTYQNIFQRR